MVNVNVKYYVIFVIFSYLIPTELAKSLFILFYLSLEIRVKPLEINYRINTVSY